jgi:hypothetical protein
MAARFHPLGDQPRRRTMSAVYVCAPDLWLKLEYLVHRRGDQRPLSHEETVRSLKQLAAALGVADGRLRQWCETGRVERSGDDAEVHLEQLCGIFGLQREWLTLPAPDFLERCEAQPISGWRGLLALAREVGVGEIAAMPADQPDILRHALPDVLPEPNCPVLVAGSRLQARFAPPLPLGGRALAGWRVVLFSQDPTGYLCLLPRFEAVPSMPLALLDANGSLTVHLKLEPMQTGRHSLVLLVFEAPLPADLLGALKTEPDPENAAATLDWLGAEGLRRFKSGAAAAFRLRYAVR